MERSSGTEAASSPDGAALRVQGLTVDFTGRDGVVHAVRGVDLSVKPGEIVGLVGESGSGKSTVARAVMRLCPPSARVDADTIEVGGTDMLRAGGPQLRHLRGQLVSMIFQDSLSALNPVITVGRQVAEAVRVHDRRVSRAAALARAEELLASAGIADAHRRLTQFPHELSGGLRQRVGIAIAIACDPRVLIADEATTALDVTIQAEILDLLRETRDRLGMAVLVITHNMGVVADVADRVVVMRSGQVVERSETHSLFAAPKADYTKQLLAAVPRLAPHPPGARLLESDRKPGTAPAGDPPPRTIAGGDVHSTGQPVLEARGVSVEFGSRGAKRVRALDDVTVSIQQGEILALVGESGSGKSTLGKCVVGLQRVTAGSLQLFGQDVTQAAGRRLKELRRRCAIVFQDPGSSLNPRMTVGECITEPLVINKAGDRRSRQRRTVELLDAVQLGGAMRSRYPHELSGGQRQRVSIARAIALRPELLVADEPTSALDVSVQATVLDLLLDLQADIGFACLFITHDLAVVSLLADTVAVMQAGRLVEVGERDRVLFHPSDPYTRRLLAAAPVPDPVEQRRRRAARLALVGAPGGDAGPELTVGHQESGRPS